MDKDSTSRVAWVTGAGKGIGRAVARQLALEGWIVGASARTSRDLTTLELECLPGTVKSMPLDVTDTLATARVIATIEEELGELDLVILNAGTHLPISVENFSVDIFRTLIETNLMGTVNGLAEIIPRFTARGCGHIAIVASLAAYRGLPTAAAYGATKVGLIHMCEALKPELQKYGISLTLINPGFVETPLTAKNKFQMPFLITSETAAKHIVRGLEKQSFEITFPWQLAAIMRVLRFLPNSLLFAITQRMLK
ncbi:MAG: oxidoreductase [Rhodospirillaceae bacterium TMED8]|nr:oxidoreductase [Magnetovibrio sp.]OUT49277.1 MAG: oxidoreductase [Rhodospirillaceae bacterium TMED8]|tara:strand:+ start:7046 stop:7807 length:762 start_codon:yes stop_codon:yes gene_type:complete